MKSRVPNCRPAREPCLWKFAGRKINFRISPSYEVLRMAGIEAGKNGELEVWGHLALDRKFWKTVIDNIDA